MTTPDLPTRVAIPAVGLFLLALAVPGCKVGPDYEPPVINPAEAYANARDDQGGGLETEPDPQLVEWWYVFADPRLTGYIEEARENNLDLRAAIARVEVSRALLGVTRGARVPEVGVEAGFSRTDLGEAPESQYSLKGGAAWEVDLFGRVRRSIESAGAAYEATAEDRQDVLLAITAETARLYLAAATASARLNTALENIDSQREIVELTRTRFKYGISSDLEVAQSEQVLASSEAEIPLFRQQMKQAIHGLAVVVGRSPSALIAEFESPEEVPLPTVEVETGVPADLLRRRPDVRRAERQLASQTARIGVAKADLYPTLSLSGFIGLVTGDVSNLFDSKSFNWQVASPLRWTIFSGGRIRSNIDAELARTDVALANYELSVLIAMREVEDAVVGLRESLIRYERLRASTDAASRTLRLSIELYKDGLSDFQSTLDAERELFSAITLSKEARGTASIGLVELYRSLGGGWDPQAQGTTGANEAVDAQMEAAAETAADDNSEEP